MKTIVRKPLMIKIIKSCGNNNAILDQREYYAMIHDTNTTRLTYSLFLVM